MSEINSQIVTNLQKKYGEAFYILDSSQFEKNYLDMKQAFSALYPKFNIAYSYKTNYIPKLCKIVNELNGYAEVVSEMELELALKCGVEAEKIIWNGPIKDRECLKKFLVLGGTVNIDSIEEAIYIEKISRNSDKVLNVGIRCNYDVQDGVVSRFGLDIEGRDFRTVLEKVTTSTKLYLKSFQCHFANRQIKYWPNRVQQMLKLLDNVGVIPEMIDFGGGIFGKMEDELKQQFSEIIPSYEEYAKVIATEFNRFFMTKERKPELIIEPGTALVGNCMEFVGVVKTIKCVRGKHFASVLGSQKNISMSGINPPIQIIHMSDGKKYDNLDFVGYTCIEGDVLYHNYSGKLAVGDVIVISNCGSYSLVMKPPFILPNFPIIDLSNNETEVIKRKENFEDIFRTFIF